MQEQLPGRAEAACNPFAFPPSLAVRWGLTEETSPVFVTRSAQAALIHQVMLR